MLRLIKKITRLNPITFIVLGLLSTQAAAEWKLTKESQNIQLYRSVNTSDEFTTLIKAEINVPLETVVHVLDDPNACQKWLYRCQSTRHISETEAHDHYTYYVRDYPFPLKDRHGVLQINKGYQEDGKFEMTFNLVHRMTPEDSTLIIPEQFTAQMRVQQKNSTTTSIELEHTLNPGGKIPNWLKKSIHEEYPYHSMHKLLESSLKRLKASSMETASSYNQDI